ncbi:hypothetical protein DBR32_04730 [Taibaiella sp. KBW10]|nr:hypothetical protein DBR32_04730 [Taibaiella sp. KBW10]
MAFLVYRKDKQKDVPVKWLPALLRFIAGSLTAGLLLAPAFSGLNNTEEKPTIIWLQDVSTSTKNALSQYQEKYQATQKATLAQLNKNYQVQIIGFGNTSIKDSIYTYTQKSTDIASAIERAAEQNQDKNIGAIIIASDGIYNEGSNPLFLQLPKPIPLYTIALGDSTTPKDIRINALHTNKTVSLGSTFEIFADIIATGLAGEQTTVSLNHNGKVLATQSLQINSINEASSISFNVVASTKGLQHYTVSVAKTGAEQNIQNNTQSAIVEVTEEKINVLLLAAAPHPDIAVIQNALKDAGQYKVDVVLNGSIPGNLKEYNVLIAYQFYAGTDLDNIPAWYILGPQNNPGLTKRIMSLTGTSPIASANEPMALLNQSFNLYTLPANIKQTLPKMPPLTGVLFQMKPGSNPLLSDQSGNSIWSYNPGKVPFSILNGTGLWRWNIYEYKNFKTQQTTPELIRQTVGFLQSPKDNKPFKLILPKHNLSDSEPLVVLAELRNSTGDLINTPEVILSVAGTGKDMNYNFEKTGNSYRLQAGLLASGTYRLTAKVSYNGKTYEDYGLCYVSDVPLEALRTQSDYELLFQMAQKSQGRFFTQYNFNNLTDSLKKDGNIKIKIHSKSEIHPLIDLKWLFFLIIAIAASEWFLRKFWGMTAS